ncbi:MAG: TonB-dependent receptor [Cyclobacteriaceae bacterium]
MRLFSTIVFMYCAFQISAQVVTVRNAETDEPLEMVSLFSETPRAFVSTNSRGQADISAFKDAEKIEIRLLGFKTQVKGFSELELDGFELRLQPFAVSMDEVVVSATRWQKPTSEVPSKVISISSRAVTLQNPQTAADLLGASGKVFIQKSQQGGGSPMIRGFATNRLLYTVDGVRMNTAIFRGGNIQNVISLDAFATENTEVLFGPGSVIYGSDAIGGVMSFQTLTPRFAHDNEPLITGKAVTRYSSANNEKTGHFDVNLGFNKWAFVTSISSYDFGDLKMGSQGPEEYLRPFYVKRIDNTDVVVTNDDPRVQVPSGYTQINMMQKVRFLPSANWDIQYGFHYSETSDYSRYDRHIRYRNGLPRYGEWKYGPQKWAMNHLNISQLSSNGLYDQLTLRLAHQYFEESRIDRDINDPERHIRVEKVNAYSANLDMIKALGERNRLYYGVEVVSNEVNSLGTDENMVTGVAMDGPARYPQSTWASYALYLNDQLKISEKTLVLAGLRYNQFQLDAEFDTRFYPFPFTTAAINNGALTGSAGIVYRPSQDWVLSANFATAFRSPNVDDVGKVFDSEPGAVTVPNPDLTAEYATNFDVGIAKLFGDNLKVDLSAYYTNLGNAMVRRDFTLNGQDSIVYDGTLSQVQAIQNAAVARVYGIQAGIEIKLPQGFGFSSDFNYQKGEEELDDGTRSPSRHAAPAFGVTRLTYSANKLSLQFYADYSAGFDFEKLPQEEKGKPEIYAVDENGNPHSPGWYTINFKALYHISEHFSISAGLENLTDQRYRPYSSGIVAPGRNFILSLRANF